MRFIRTFINFATRLWQQRALIYSMAVRELHFRYAGTSAGLIWSVVNPLAMIAVYWFVFSVGLKVQPMGDTPFILVFMCGFAPWSLFAEAINGSVECVSGSAYLVKKTVFPTEILPVVQIVSALPTHAVMLVVLAVIMQLNGHSLSFHSLQFLYSVFALSVFMLGVSWFLAALNVFLRDVSQILGVLLNIWFWMTPIVWPVGMLSEKYAFWLKANPMFYIVDGYRAAFLTHEPIFRDPAWSIYFWAVTLGMFLFGGCVFKRLKPEFPDVI